MKPKTSMRQRSINTPEARQKRKKKFLGIRATKDHPAGQPCRRCGGISRLVQYEYDPDVASWFVACTGLCNEQVFHTQREAVVNWNRFEGDSHNRKENRDARKSAEQYHALLSIMARCSICGNIRKCKRSCSSRDTNTRAHKFLSRARDVLYLKDKRWIDRLVHQGVPTVSGVGSQALVPASEQASTEHEEN